VPEPIIEAVVGHITHADAEAIVNAANSQLWMGGGVAGAIKNAGGEGIEREAMSQGPIQPGEAVVTSAGTLPPPIRWVIHAATMGPDLQTSEELIRSATASALRAAAKIGARSIAFPALGTGVGGFPVARAADVMVEEARRVSASGASFERIVFVLRDRSAHEAFGQAIRASQP
jgi:O-acetyl-ADP-ribose deacetylase (regulator of RNase III)